jgi:hypothetical protein
LTVVPAPADWTALTETLWARCEGLCEACGLSLPEDGWDRHHRQSREFGLHAPQNLVALHKDCHVLTPWSVHQRPQWAREQGLIVPSWSTPASSALWLPDGRLVLLTPEGDYSVIMEGDSDA